MTDRASSRRSRLKLCPRPPNAEVIEIVDSPDEGDELQVVAPATTRATPTKQQARANHPPPDTPPAATAGASKARTPTRSVLHSPLAKAFQRAKKRVRAEGADEAMAEKKAAHKHAATPRVSLSSLAAPPQQDGEMESQSQEEGPDDRTEALLLGSLGSMGDTVGSVECSVVGRAFCKPSRCVCEEVGTAKVVLKRDPNNPVDANAIAVCLEGDGAMLGHVPRRIALVLAPATDHGFVDISATATCAQPLDKVANEDEDHTHPMHLAIDVRVGRVAPVTNEEKRIALCARVGVQRLGEQRGSVLSCLDNFRTVVHGCLERHALLLTAQEKQRVDDISALPQDAQRLLVRLYNRKGPWFRVHALQYPEVPSIAKAVHALHAAALVCVVDTSAHGNEPVDTDTMWEVAELLTVKEIGRVMSKLGWKDWRTSGCPKRLLLRRLRRQSRTQRTLRCVSLADQLAKHLCQQAGRCVRVEPTVAKQLDLMHRLFFLSRSHKSSTLVREQMGHLQFHPYKVVDSSPLFASREHLDQYFHADDMLAQMERMCVDLRGQVSVACLPDDDEVVTVEAVMELFDVVRTGLSRAVEALPGTECSSERALGTVIFQNHFTAACAFTEAVWQGVGVLEWKKPFGAEPSYEVATTVLRDLLSRPSLCPGRRGKWWDRLTVNLFSNLKRAHEALDACNEALADAWTRGGQRLSIEHRRERIVGLLQPSPQQSQPSCKSRRKRRSTGERLTDPWGEVKVELRAEPMSECRFVGYDGEVVRVEHLVVQHFALPENGAWCGAHCEGSVWLTLFGLLLWDQVFDASVPGVFQTRFQSHPLDLSMDSFYLSRREQIEARLRAVSRWTAPRLRGEVVALWVAHYGRACQGVNWGHPAFPPHTLATFAACVGGRRLSCVLRVLAKDYAHWHSGMPDLVLWRDLQAPSQAGEGCGDVWVVEVKSENDTLMDTQKAWIRELLGIGLDVSVAKVRNVFNPRTKRRRKDAALVEEEPSG